jgi:hypothetical protein
MDVKDPEELEEERGPLGPPALGQPPMPPDAETPEETEEPVEQPSPTPQLIRSTKPAAVEPPVEEEPDEEDELNEHVDDPGDPDGVHAAEEEQRWREEHPLPPVTPGGAAKRRHPLIKVLIILIVIIAAAFGAYWFGGHEGSTPAKKTGTQHAQTGTPNHPLVPAETLTKHYDSTIYTLSFDYPATWAVSDTTTKLTVTSPAMQLSAIGGKKVDAHIVVTVQNQQASIPGFPASGALATLASDKLTYKQPTSIQRAQTYLSYLGYSTTNGLDVLYITGDSGYQQGQQVPMSDVVKGNPLISVTFETCASSGCSTGTPVPQTLLASSWLATQASKDVTSLLESIQLN